MLEKYKYTYEVTRQIKVNRKMIHAVSDYTQYPIIRNVLIRNSTEFFGKFKKRALGRSNLRNASKNLRNGQRSDFQS